jgi:Asp-tRNA(Asn)/Glu-tRNA(Gln) amidotransferase A subunit family amidase
MTELARMIASKKVSPVEVVQAHLDRIKALDGKLKSYITVMGDSALVAAKAAAQAAADPSVMPPAHGGWRHFSTIPLATF